MDNDFAQSMLEKVEKRNKMMGISNSPLRERNAESTTPTTHNSRGSVRTPRKEALAAGALMRKDTLSSPKNKVAQRVSDRKLPVDAKENSDLSVEINITTGPNVQVQVEVEEREVDEAGNVLSSSTCRSKALEVNEDIDSQVSLIRDSSRNRLQRLGALYSNAENLSSPIHRNESRFDEQNIQSREGAPKLKSRFANLANSINSWEDESSNSDGKDDAQSKKTATQGNKVTTSTVAKSRTPTTVTTSKVKSDEPKIVGMCPRKNENGSKGNGTGAIPKTKNNSIEKSKESQIKWDQKVMNDLERQGFKRRDTAMTHLTYDYKETNGKGDAKSKETSIVQKEIASLASALEATKPVEKKSQGISKGIVSGRTALFEQSGQTERRVNRNQKDPAEMSLRERLAIFEKNPGEALVPKAALGMSVSAKQIMADQKITSDVKKPIISLGGGGGGYSSANTSSSKPVQAVQAAPSKVQPYNKSVVADSNASGSGIKQTVAALLTNQSTISESQISADMRRVREEEMNVLLNRFNNQGNHSIEPTAPPMTPPPPPPPMPTDLLSQNSKNRNHKRRSDEKTEASPQVRINQDDNKRVKINPSKENRLYPVLPDFDTNSDKDQYYSTEETPKIKNVRFQYDEQTYSSQEDDDDSYMDSEENASFHENNLNNSFRRDVLGAARPKELQYLDSSTTSSVDGNEGVDMDDYLDEALEDDDYDSDQYGPKKGNSISSNSFSYERRPMNYSRPQTIREEAMVNENDYRSPVKSKLTATEEDDKVTLTHTVSFYRRQQSQTSNTPVRKVLHKGERESATYDSEECDDIFSGERYIQAQKGAVEDKIKELLQNVGIQQQHISQASNALNTCASTFEFSGSTEAVAAERTLLVATHCRQAALNEVSRLRVERCLRSADAPKECGRLTVREITLPLRQDYISKLTSEAISGHNLVCLLKHNEQVLATKTIPTLPGLLAVKFPCILQIDNVYADFKATLEVYGMTAQREVLAHDVKYHIKNKKGVIKTPKGKKPESRLVMPPVQSPAGPNAVRTPSFTQYGFAIFSLRESHRSNWTLNQVSGISPLVGNVYMKVNCELSVNIDYKGFLTMFEDISGFGAWHRRWCRLNGTVFSYWKYPDDERKPPIGTLDLTTCEQQKIAVAPRDVCARLNTLLLELKRPCQPDDRDSLVMVRAGNQTIIRHLLSADTKEERDEWNIHLNKALTLMRAWGSAR